MEIKLDYTEKRDNMRFYRYLVGETAVWFNQYENGCIYTVVVDLPNDLTDLVAFYVETDGARRNQRDTYYPYDFYIHIRKESYGSELEAYIEKLKTVKEIGDTIMSIFQKPEHKDLYDKFIQRKTTKNAGN